MVASLNEANFCDYELGFARHSYWREVFNSDVHDGWVNPWGAGNPGGIRAEGHSIHGLPQSTKIVIPANSVCSLRSKPRTKFSRRSATGVSPIMGQYANYLEIGHNEHEFVFDFGESYENDEPTRVHTRIVTGPVYAKVFLKLLQSAMAEYEESYGPLDVREFRK